MTITRAELATMDFSDITTGERLAHVTPGDVLLHEFMIPLNLSIPDVAYGTGLTINCIADIIAGDRMITESTAWRFKKRFGASLQFWLNLQSAHDLEVMRHRPPESFMPNRIIPAASHKRATKLAQAKDADAKQETLDAKSEKPESTKK